MNQYYDEIMEIKGIGGIKKTVKNWGNLSKNIKSTKAEKLNILPDMLWISSNSINKTELLNLLGKYLYSLGNLLNFSSDRRFIEFYLGYDEGDKNFSEFTRFRATLNFVKGFKNYYEGIVFVDISEWVEHSDDKRFIAFLEFLASNTDDWLVILNINKKSLKKIADIEGTISTYLRIEKIVFELPKTADLFEYAAQTLALYDFYLNSEAENLLRKSIEKMRGSKRFDGVNSIKYMCSDIIYSSLSRKGGDHFLLTAEDLSEFSSDSDYVMRLIENSEKRELNKIGF